MVLSTKKESLYLEGHVEHELAAVYTAPAIPSAIADIVYVNISLISMLE